MPLVEGVYRSSLSIRWQPKYPKSHITINPQAYKPERSLLTHPGLRVIKPIS